MNELSISYLFEQLYQAGLPLGLIDELPLFELFVRLRKALSLGIDDYWLLLQALQGGFGLKDRDDLKRLCQTLWVKSDNDQSKFEECFERLMPKPGEQKLIPPDPPDGSSEEVRAAAGRRRRRVFDRPRARPGDPLFR